MRSLPSLRLWLLSSSVLSVVAGYTLLLGINGVLASKQRLAAHQALVQSLADQHRSSGLNKQALQLLGVEIAFQGAGAAQMALLDQGSADQAWLVSATPVRSKANQEQLLVVRQDVSASLAYERNVQLLLIAGAGVSTLLTAALLRLVLWRGLVRPLHDLSDQLDALKADGLGDQLIALEQQPLELQPIASAFNGLQQRLAAAWHRERRFVDGVAHELRTPITLISGRSQRLLRKPHAPEQQQPLAQIAAEATRMATLIAALLELARTDSGRLSLDLQSCDPEQLLLEAFERFQPLAPTRLQLAPSTPDGCPAIQVDPERLQQCLLALVDNALAYSQGSVLLSASCGSDANGPWVGLHVLDRGPGIPEAEREEVLERFVRGTTAVGTRGSGIGLSVVQELTHAMAAELRIEDRDGGGANLQLLFRV